MRVLKNRRKADCGIVAVANATGQSYAAVRRAFRRRLPRNGLSIAQLEDLLSRFVGWNVVNSRWLGSLAFFLAKPHYQRGRFIAVLGLYDDCHAVAIVDGKALNADGWGGEWVSRMYRIHSPRV